jgi:hypothetical protein
MINESFDPWEAFFGFLFINTNLSNYETFSDESKRKLTERMTILLCYEFSPKKNYGISKAEIREFVGKEIEHIANNLDFYYKE